MSEQPIPSQQIIDSLEDQLELQDKINVEMKELELPDAETERRMREEAEHEVFADTPAKAVLWEGRTGLNNLTHASPRVKNLAMAELVEAYAVISPDDGYAVLQDISVGDSWVEAMAKFGYIKNDETFVTRALEYAKLPSDIPKPRMWDITEGDAFYAAAEFNHKRDKRKIDMENSARLKLGIVADTAKDPEAMSLLYDRRNSDPISWPNQLKRPEDLKLKPPFDDLGYLLASIGYMPAITQQKQQLLAQVQSAEYRFTLDEREAELDKLDKKIAGIITVEHQIQEKTLTPQYAQQDEPPGEDEEQALKTAWWQLISQRRQGILNELQHPEKLLPKVPSGFERFVRQSKPDLREEDLRATIDWYVKQLQEHGGEFIAQAIKDYPEQSPDTRDWNLLCLYRAIKEEALRLHEEEIAKLAA